MTINNLSVVSKGNSKSRLTVTQDNDVRIKIGVDVYEEDVEETIEKLTKAAETVIDNGYNAQTLRGTHKPHNTKIQLATNQKIKANRAKYTIDLI